MEANSSDKVLNIVNKIRTVYDFPKKGIAFKDITTALKCSQTLKAIIDLFAQRYEGQKIDIVAGIESRGFLFALPLALRLNAGFVPVRKKGKLPAPTISESYELEYGFDTIEIHKDALTQGQNVLLVDDLLATGGTALAACKLIKQSGANLIGSAFFIELSDLDGKQRLLNETEIFSLITY
jgi:adenine phosphoribosyltransferase